MAILLAVPRPAAAMHIAEGILPPTWWSLWTAIAVAFVAWGIWRVNRASATNLRFKPMLALVGAAVFIISCMPVPVPTAGTCSHPCGTGIAAILVGPGPTVFVASIALVFQALFLAHGGLTTLGADIVSMGVVGALVGFSVFHLLRRLAVPLAVAAFFAGVLSDWATYATTAYQLASALHGESSLWGVYTAILLAFVPTQLPLGILEGVAAAGAVRFIMARRPELIGLASLSVQNGSHTA